MSGIFLGRPLHWLVLLVVVALGWLAGRSRLHVTDFNLFTICVLAGTVAVLLLVLATSPSGQRITRDPIEDEPGE